MQFEAVATITFRRCQSM